MRRRLILILLSCFFCLKLFCETGEYQGDPPHSGMTDTQLEEIIRDGSSEQSELATQILTDRHRTSRKADLERRISELIAELDSIRTNHNGESDLAAIDREISELNAEFQNINKEIAAEKQNNTSTSDSKKSEKNSATAGDPVKTSVGVYVQKESDIKAGLLEITRKYESDSKIISSMGRGWSFNFDQRIILGTEPKASEKYAKLLEKSAVLDSANESYEWNIRREFGIQNLASGHEVFNSKISQCNALRTKAEAIEAEAEGDYDISSIYSSINQKIKMIEGVMRDFDYAVSRLERIQEEAESIKVELQEYKRNTVDISAQRKARNKKVMFAGSDSYYEETGLNTITIIDEEGSPHILYETSNGSKFWKNLSDYKYVSCRKNGSNYILLECDGTEKIFNEDGFIIKISDRNNNSIIVHRVSDGRISDIETSDGEQFLFSYTGILISEIKNARAPEENIIYTYKGNNLIAVRDTDGDTVAMEYNVNGQMIALNKCDGSSVHFIYGEHSADGKKLITETVNEEGFSEFFNYQKSQKCTRYTDQDRNITTYFYDDKHHTVREERPDGTIIKNNYDANGNLVINNENGNIINYKYDEKGNRISAFYEDASFENWTYDNYNQINSYTDRDGIREDFLRNEKGNVVEYQKGHKTVYRLEYNSKGKIIRQTVFGQKQIVTSYNYDSYGNVTSEICGDVKKTCEYDNRNRIAKEFINGRLTREYLYEAHKIIQRDYNGLETVYITNGRKDVEKIIQKDTVSGEIHQTRIEYDKRHLPLRMYWGDGISEELTLICLYTAAGKIQTEIIPGEEDWVRFFKYKNNKISEVIQFKTNIDEQVKKSQIDLNMINELLAEKGDDIYVQKYDYMIRNKNQKSIKIFNGSEVTDIFEYDSFGNLLIKTDGNGKSLQNKFTKAGRCSGEQSLYGGWYEYIYDASGRLSSSGEENGSKEKYEYNPDGTLQRYTDFYGKITSYNYDNRGRLVNVYQESGTITYEYDLFDRVIKVIKTSSCAPDNCRYMIRYDYALDGRSVLITEGEKYKKIIILDAFNNVVKIIDGENNERSFVYNSRNQQITSYDGYNNKSVYKYNGLGKVSKTLMPDGTETFYVYNCLGEITTITDECGLLYKAEYDRSGYLVKEFNRADAEKQYVYDKSGRLKEMHCGDMLVEAYVYSSTDNVVTVYDGEQNEYKYTYDEYGRLIQEVNRNQLVQKYYYDEAGMLKSKKMFDGSIIKISNSKNNCERYEQFSDNFNKYIYDVTGNLLTMENQNETNTYVYDTGGRLIYQLEKSTGEEIYMDYDQAGNRIRLKSSNRDISYSYGKNNELKEIFDNKQRIHVKLEYDKNGREVLRRFSNGIIEETLYDKAGRITVKRQKSSQGNLLWGEGYVYGVNGKRVADIDSSGRITLYEYNNQGQLAVTYYTYTEELIQKIKKEAELNGLPVTAQTVESVYLNSELKAKLITLLNSMQFGLAYNISTFQNLIKESYSYDRNGNRIKKETAYGSIDFVYDKENRLISSGSRGVSYIRYSYDKMGNLLTEDSPEKSSKYAYNSQNRLIYSEVNNFVSKTCSKTRYAYDAASRRTFIQDEGKSMLHTVYDGFSLNILKQSPIFSNGLFTDSNENGIHWGKTGQPTGERYRYLADENKRETDRYIFMEEENYKSVSTRYYGERAPLFIEDKIAAQTTSETEPEYFTTDILGSVRSVTDASGKFQNNYSYDAFGYIVSGELSESSDFGYLSKQLDTTSSFYNYGFRDYSPQNSRFTTTDPIRDGTNWFQYCNGDPVNFVDVNGLFYYGESGQKSITTVKKTIVVILRNNDDVGNEFDSTRLIYKNDGINTKLAYVDSVGANCKAEYNGTKGSTTPDGTYYLSNGILNKQADGTYNSKSYNNVLSLMTSDSNLTQEQRDMVNTGDRLFHANQRKQDKDGPYNSNKEPGSAGCIIGKDGQKQHNKMMEILMDGVKNPESIKVIIKSMNNVGCRK